MKAMVDIPSALLERARRAARRYRTALDALVAMGLRNVLRTYAGGTRVFRLRDARFRGDGLRVKGSSTWEAMLDAIYQDRRAPTSRASTRAD
jgi:hypothetical protein